MQTIMDNLAPILVLSINLLVTISYFVICFNQKMKTTFSRLPVPVQKLYVAFFVAPLFIAPFLPQARFMSQHIVLILIGIAVAAGGVLLIGLSFFRIGVVPSIKSRGGLATTGAYGLVRHPIYAGTIIAQLGLIIMNQSLISLFYWPISILLYFLMATIEEMDLVKMFGEEYIEYRKKTKKKILPFIL